MSILSEKTWARHSNAWSGWTRVLSMPLIGVGLYLHSFVILGVAIVWLVINPLVFPRPKNVDNWMSRGVLGEQEYFKDGKKLRYDVPTLLNILNIPVFVAFLYYGWHQNLEALVLAGFLVMTLKFWFIDRMSLLV